MKKELGVFLLIAASLLSAEGKNETSSSKEQFTMTILYDAITWTKANLDINESPELAAWEELTDTDLTYITPPHANFEEKVNLYFASGDYPDVLCSGKIARFASNGDLIELTDYVNGPSGQKIMQATGLGNDDFAASTFSGKIYGIPIRSALSDASEGFMIRQDWLNKLKLSLPETLDEYRVVLNAFTYGDPDGNGKDDTYGATCRSNFTYMRSFMGAFDLNSTHRNLAWDFIDGKAVAQCTQDKYKDYLSYMRTLIYDDKVFTPDALFNTSDQWKEEIFNSTAGLWDHSSTRVDEFFMKNMIKANPDWEARGIAIGLPLPPLSDKGFGGFTKRPKSDADIMITIGAEDPDRIMEYWTNVFTRRDWTEFAKYGLEGKHHILNGGKKEWHPDAKSDERRQQLKGLVYLHSRYPIDEEDIRDLYGERALEAYTINQKYSRPMDMELVGKPVLEAEQIYAELGTVKLEYTMKILLGQISLEEGWMEMQQVLIDEGLNEVQRAVQEWYNANTL